MTDAWAAWREKLAHALFRTAHRLAPNRVWRDAWRDNAGAYGIPFLARLRADGPILTVRECPPGTVMPPASRGPVAANIQ